MSKALLITGATGKQGGAVVNALLADKSSDFTILAVTRKASSPAAQRLLAKSPRVKLVQGDLDDVSTLFARAREVSTTPIWGVFSVQISMGKGVTLESEVKQGVDLINEAVKQGVKHFVYSSVERGGDEASWENPTPVQHFVSKYRIEHHLRDHAGGMGWTILRPVGFMDNLEPGFQSKVFLTAMHNILGEKSSQWVAVSDIGVFVAKAFAAPNEWNHKALGLAGDELSVSGVESEAKAALGSPIGSTFRFLGNLLTWGVTEMGLMINWWKTDGYRADIAKVRGLHPELKSMRTWLATESKFQNKNVHG